MNKIITLEEYKGTFLEKCYTSEPLDLKKVFDTLNNNLEKSLISVDLYDKSMSQLDSILEKAKNHKWIKRTGTPGNYKYEYANGDGKASERAMTDSLNEKVGVKKVEGIKNEMKTPKHISDMSKEEKHSMAAKMGIEGHKEMTEKELSKQLIDRKIDSELKGGKGILEDKTSKVKPEDIKINGEKVTDIGEGHKKGDKVTYENKSYIVDFVDKTSKTAYLRDLRGVPAVDSKGDMLQVHTSRLSKDNINKSEDSKKDLKELVDEHKQLVNVLDSDSKKDDKEESKKQKKELEGYKKELKKSFDENIEILKS